MDYPEDRRFPSRERSLLSVTMMFRSDAKRKRMKCIFHIASAFSPIYLIAINEVRLGNSLRMVFVMLYKFLYED